MPVSNETWVTVGAADVDELVEEGVLDVDDVDVGVDDVVCELVECVVLVDVCLVEVEVGV